jgi:prefoldin subunit 5
MSLIIILNFINKIMSKLDKLYKQKEAILKELNKLSNKERGL